MHHREGLCSSAPQRYGCDPLVPSRRPTPRNESPAVRVLRCGYDQVVPETKCPRTLGYSTNFRQERHSYGESEKNKPTSPPVSPRCKAEILADVIQPLGPVGVLVVLGLIYPTSGAGAHAPAPNVKRYLAAGFAAGLPLNLYAVTRRMRLVTLSHTGNARASTSLD